MGYFKLTTLLDFDAEGAALPTLRGIPSDHSHAFPVFEEILQTPVAGKSAPEHGALTPSSADSSLKASRTTSNSSVVLSRSGFRHSLTLMVGASNSPFVVISLVHCQTHSNSEFMVFGGSGDDPSLVPSASALEIEAQQQVQAPQRPRSSPSWTLVCQHLPIPPSRQCFR